MVDFRETAPGLSNQTMYSNNSDRQPRYQTELARIELTRIILSQRTPHSTEACLSAYLENYGAWKYCIRAMESFLGKLSSNLRSKSPVTAS